jgi:hypothetical protein
MGPPPIFIHPAAETESEDSFRRFRDDKGRIDPFVDEEADESEWHDTDLGGFPRGLSLVRICLGIVWKDKEILAYQILSAVLCLALLFLFISALIPSYDSETVNRVVESPEFVVKLFPYYVIAFFVATFFKAATIAVATIRMKGGNPVFADGVEAASRKVLPILGWAILSAVVGVLLAVISRRGRGARVAARVAGAAWSVTTYFSVPVILFEDEGPLSAIERSAHIVRRTWRESLAGNFGMSLVFFGLALIGVFLAFPVAYALGGILVGILVLIAYVAVLSIFSSAASGVLVASLYRLARTGKAPEELDKYEPLSSAVAAFAPSPSTERAFSADAPLCVRMPRRL